MDPRLLKSSPVLGLDAQSPNSRLTPDCLHRRQAPSLNRSPASSLPSSGSRKAKKGRLIGSPLPPSESSLFSLSRHPIIIVIHKHNNLANASRTLPHSYPYPYLFLEVGVKSTPQYCMLPGRELIIFKIISLTGGWATCGLVYWMSGLRSATIGIRVGGLGWSGSEGLGCYVLIIPTSES